jgi:iron complex outermembrane receptor protein
MLFLTVSLAAVNCAFSVFANNSEDSFDAIALLDLIVLDVSAVSKKTESIASAPGVVTVINAQQIAELGARNLSDILATVPGLFVFDNYFSLSDQVSIRGNLSEDYNTKVLLLINGHPAYHALHGTFFTDMVPIDAIHRVEVIRGPASVLYGTNALTGVINVITKMDLAKLPNGTQDKRGTVSFSAGDHGSYETKLNFANQWDGGRAFISAAVKSQQGYNIHILPDQDSQLDTAGQQSQSNEYEQLFTQVALGGLEVDINLFEQARTAKYGVLPTLLTPNTKPFDISLFSADVRYNQLLSGLDLVHYIFRYDQYDYDYTVGNYQLLQGDFSAPYREGVGHWFSRKFGAEVYADIAFKNGDLVAGVLWDEYRGDKVIFETGVSEPFDLIPIDSKNRDVSLYANSRYRFEDSPTQWVAGLRFTNNQISGDHFDYRVGAMYTYSPDTVLKLLWGTSYRSPNFNELNVDAPPVIAGNRDLDFEVLKGLDLSLHTTGEFLVFSLNYFYNKTDSQIATLPDSSGVPSYHNIQGQESSGIEFDLTVLTSQQSKFYIRGSYLLDVDDVATGEELSRYTRQTMVAGGFSWTPMVQFKTSLSLIHNGRWLNSGSYNLINMSLEYQLQQYDHLMFYLYVNNAGDKAFTHASWQVRQIDTLPGGKPREYRLGVKYQW